MLVPFVCLYLISKLHPMVCCDCDSNALELYFTKYGQTKTAAASARSSMYTLQTTQWRCLVLIPIFHTIIIIMMKKNSYDIAAWIQWTMRLSFTLPYMPILYAWVCEKHAHLLHHSWMHFIQCRHCYFPLNFVMDWIII